MQPQSSSVPAPDPRREPVAPPPQVPRPTVVPPREPGRRRKALWISLVLLVVAAGVGLYLKSRPSLTGGGGPVITVPTVTAVVGDLDRKVRVTGTVAAKNFAALLAPRIQGSRSNTNRGGMGGSLGAGPAGGGGPGGGDFNLILLHLAKAGHRSRRTPWWPSSTRPTSFSGWTTTRTRSSRTQLTVRKIMANLAASKETLDQTVRAAKASWQQALLDLQTAPVRSEIQKGAV